MTSSDDNIMMCPAIDGGVRVCVPADTSLLTPYILLEQEDWFEDEIRFVRRFLRPGMKVVDIGANYGVYTLSAARIVGTEGKVWAFEPSSRCRRFLKASLERNCLRNVEVVGMALGDRAGTARLVVADNPELGEITEGNGPAQGSESVDIGTLDQYGSASGWEDVHFVKLDAEGYETRIISGGKEFFRTNSSLVMYERVHGSKVDTSITDALRDLGYEPYSLIPGLMVLMPASPEVGREFQPLNLFGCRPDTALRLRELGLLVDGNKNCCVPPKGTWRELLYGLPYGTMLRDHWENFVGRAAQSAYWVALEPALDAYAAARSSSISIEERYACLRQSYELLKRVAGTHPSFMSLLSFGRVAAEFGGRNVARAAFDPLVQAIASGRPIDVPGPFLAANARFETLSPDPAVANWLFSSVVESLERTRAFSSYFSPEPGLVGLHSMTKCNALGERPPRAFGN